ncbi:MAG: amidohydrolase [Oscillospiraceae bacterium]
MMHFSEENHQADQVYLNGNILTADKEFRVVQAMALQGDHILDVGTDEEMKWLAGPNTRIVDLNGKTVMPGIIESHLHMRDLGMSKLDIDCHGMNKEQLLAAVADRCKTTPAGGWICGMGWNQAEWNAKDFPKKEELDAVTTTIPVYLQRCCGHASWANSKALELAGIGPNTPNPVGGEIIRENGNAIGIFTDQAQEFFNRVIPPLTDEDTKRAFLLAQEEFFRYGITTIHDAGSSTEVLELWEQLYRDEKLKLRIYSMLRVPGRPDYDELYHTVLRYLQRGLVIGKYNHRLTVRSLKISADGSLGARSAWMLEDYADRPGHKGNGKLTDEQLYRVIYEARKHGFQVMVHAIGDACNKQVLDVYERVFNALPDPDHRCRIEHSQVLRLEDIPRFAQLGVVPSVQPITIGADKEVALARVGTERIAGAYAWRKLIDAGCKIFPISTDAPVDYLNPFYNIYSAVARKDIHQNPEGGWYKENALTRKEALLGATYMGAMAGFEEGKKGSLERGKLADFIIVSDDMMHCPEDAIKDIVVLETVLGGECVYRR